MNATGTPPHLPAGRGVHWLTDAVRMVVAHPAPLLVMGLIVAAIQMIPILGGFALLIAGPALIAGSISACRRLDAGQPAPIRELFSFIERPRVRGQALRLCLPLLAGKLAALLVITSALTHNLKATGADLEALRTDPGKLLEALGSNSMLGWLAVAVVIVLLSWTFVALAIPEVAMRERSFGDAVRTSLAAVWHNLAPWIVATLLLFALMLLLATALMLTRSVLIAQLGLYTGFYAVIGPLLYGAWRDVLGSRPSVPAPEAATKPSGTLAA